MFFDQEVINNFTSLVVVDFVDVLCVGALVVVVGIVFVFVIAIW